MCKSLINEEISRVNQTILYLQTLVLSTLIGGMYKLTVFNYRFSVKFQY